MNKLNSNLILYYHQIRIGLKIIRKKKIIKNNYDLRAIQKFSLG